MKTIKKTNGYKGFDKNLSCREKQYEIGKNYTEDNAILCQEGMHFCKNPHDIFKYYPAGNGSRFCEVEADDVTDEHKYDSKRVAKSLFIKKEISVFQICRIAVSTFFENFGFKKKIESNNANKVGDYSVVMNAGDNGAANAGDYGTANAGDNGVAVVANNGNVKGGVGCILVARNFKYNDKKNICEVTDWACAIVDNVNIKADTWYHLVNGELKEVRNEKI